MSETKTENRALARAIEWAGSREHLAHACRVSVSTIAMWEKDGQTSKMGARLIALLMDRPRMEKGLRG